MSVPVAVALAGLALAGLPSELTPSGARYRVEVGGARIGVATLRVREDGSPRRLEVRWTTELRLPAEAGGAVRRRVLRAFIDPEGRSLGAARLGVDGVETDLPLGDGTAPATAAELLLLRREAGACLTITEEETGRTGPACVEGGVPGAVRRLTVLGIEEEVRSGADGLPDRVDLPAQRVAYVRDRSAEVPARVPLSVRVRGPDDPARAARFCGQAPDAAAPAGAVAALPAVHPTGRPCQAQAAAYAAAARARGLAARVAVGVAHDGLGFVWHAWTEVRTAHGWVPVDPAFGQVPARGPRFTVARHAGDAGSLQDAGRRILECWGTAVE